MRRFISSDNRVSRIGGAIRGYNLFSYCFNNPVVMKDLNGNWRKWVRAISKAVISVATVVLPITKGASHAVQKISLPKAGVPGSSQVLPNPDGPPKQKRWYGPDGNAVRDRDYNHSGNLPFPHNHEWENGKRGKEHLPPSSKYEISVEPIAGAALFTICIIELGALAADDITGIGAADDCLLGPLSGGASKGLIMIFG